MSHRKYKDKPEQILLGVILPDKLNEELYNQHKKQTEKSLKKLVVFLAALFVFIIVAYFFV